MRYAGLFQNLAEISVMFLSIEMRGAGHVPHDQIAENFSRHDSGTSSRS
jgi:hypothetical protein